MLIYTCVGLYEYLLVSSTLHGMYVECYIECCNAFATLKPGQLASSDQS